MINKILFHIVLGAFLTSCTSTIDKPIRITIDQSILPECESAACPQVFIEYITYDGPQEKVLLINDSIHRFIINALNLGDPNAPAIAENPQEAIATFIKDYWRDTSEFPDTNEYEAEVSVVEHFRSKEIISIGLSQYSYVGGAHGYSSYTYVNVDVKTGEILTNNQLIKDKKGLAKIAEKKLRENYKVLEMDNINTSIFWFEEDIFYVSKHIGFEGDHLVIHYNPYEIASYADGAINITLPLEDVAPFLNYSIQK